MCLYPAILQFFQAENNKSDPGRPHGANDFKSGKRIELPKEIRDFANLYWQKPDKVLWEWILRVETGKEGNNVRWG